MPAMFALMEVVDLSRKLMLEQYPSFDLAWAALNQRPDLVFGEVDADHPGCADAFLADGRLVVIEPVDAAPAPSANQESPK